jgi:2-amino-4-hydroxy-6-hydroxymethyldihydropteridine diphosphokinase
MNRVTLSIGSNVGDRRAHLQSVVDALASAVLTVSPVYETAAWGPVPQDDYLNAVLIAAGPDDDPRGWLDRAQALEQAAGRERTVRWGPRTLDVDVLQVVGGDGVAVRSDDPELTLPHPRAHERAFVLVPWADVDPTATLAGHGTVGELAAALGPHELATVRRRADLALAVRVR